MAAELQTLIIEVAANSHHIVRAILRKHVQHVLGRPRGNIEDGWTSAKAPLYSLADQIEAEAQAEAEADRKAFVADVTAHIRAAEPAEVRELVRGELSPMGHTLTVPLGSKVTIEYPRD